MDIAVQRGNAAAVVGTLPLITNIDRYASWTINLYAILVVVIINFVYYIFFKWTMFIYTYELCIFLVKLIYVNTGT